MKAQWRRKPFKKKGESDSYNTYDKDGYPTTIQPYMIEIFGTISGGETNNYGKTNQNSANIYEPVKKRKKKLVWQKANANRSKLDKQNYKEKTLK